MKRSGNSSRGKKVRYGVIGLGHIAQSAVLPGFAGAKKNSELSVLISQDETKLKKLGRQYDVKHLYLEDEIEHCLDSGLMDALYIATPNTDHQRYAEAAARAGVHVLCEKPLAEDVESGLAMYDAIQASDIKFMTAYRLHFDAANLKVIQMAKSKQLGELRMLNSTFSFQVKDKENIRLKKEKGGGPLRDIGLYCINASRYVFSAEPTEVFAYAASLESDNRFEDVPEMLSVSLRFPNDRLAHFMCSFGVADSSYFDLLGTKGRIFLDQAYEYALPMEMRIFKGEKKKIVKFKKHDQFAAELLYFSDCILKDKIPEPSLLEGLIDLTIVEAIERSLESGRPERVYTFEKSRRPSPAQKITRPGHPEPDTMSVSSPSSKH